MTLEGLMDHSHLTATLDAITRSQGPISFSTPRKGQKMSQDDAGRHRATWKSRSEEGRREEGLGGRGQVGAQAMEPPRALCDGTRWKL